MQWMNLRRDQIEALDRDTPVIVPTAAIEQHSLHLPVSTDTTIVTGICSAVDTASEADVLVTPTLWLGCSRHHRDYPGTLTTELDHFSASLFDVVDSVLHAGFRKVLILNGHGGNGAILSVTLEKLQHTHPDRVLLSASYWDIAGPAMAKVRRSSAGGMGHAGEMETAVMLALAPELVNMTRAAKDGLQSQSRFTHVDMLGLGSGPGRVGRVRPFEAMSKHGGFGDPTDATAEQGRAFLDAIVSEILVLLDDLRSDRV
ncbi:MAG: creatininase family protein [Planctomycetota bacterium]